MTESRKIENRGADGLRKIHSEEGLRQADREFTVDEARVDYDPDDEVEPGVLLKPSGVETDSADPDLRSDDESQPDVHRKFRRSAEGRR